MSGGFLTHIANLIKESNIVIEIIDARRPDETRNPQLEKQVKSKRKTLVIVMNKSDLVEDKKFLEQKKSEISAATRSKVIFVSALERDGMNMIRKEIGMVKGNEAEKETIIGIIGYPNVGKSTLINALAGKGRGRVATSRKAGLTRGLSRVKVTDNVYLIDSPGIIPFKEEEFNLFLVESKNPNQLKDPELAAVKLVDYLGKERIAKGYELDLEKALKCDEDELIEMIAAKRNMLQKGGVPDYRKGARDLLEKYQRHEL
jgi:ribosome biogenesis GTPase A